MTKIEFQHFDQDGDGFTLFATPVKGESLLLDIQSESNGIFLDHDAVVRLHAALGAYLEEGN